jgi:hypothetical protein
MRYSRQIFLLFLVPLQLMTMGQQDERKLVEIPSSFCISGMDFKLFTMINDYRARYGLAPIPLSKSLSYVAYTHVRDLLLYHPDQGPCNSHSWSANGTWKPFCYPRDENKKNSVWDKPKELTKYKGKGYEIVYWENGPAVIDSIIAFWKSVDYFNSFLMNTGKWNGKKWNAIGISIYENYAAAWFGEVPDPEGPATVCGSVPPINPKKEQVNLEEQKKPKSVEKASPVKKIKESEIKKQDSLKKEKPASKAEEEKKKVQTPVPVELTQDSPARYFIVVKSQSPRNEMLQALEEIKAQGFRQARLLEKDNKLRISVFDIEMKPIADSALREIKKIYKDAWILKQ